MTWDDCLKLGPTKLAAILGCKTTTASSWIHRSGPPEWQKKYFLRAVAEHMQSNPPMKKARKPKGG